MKETIFKIKNKRLINANKLPSLPGVYLFYSPKGKIIYIGKAKNVKKRIKNHFQNKNYKSARIVKRAEKLRIITTNSDTDALIKESELIKKYQPNLNLLLRDDKNYFFVIISKGQFPKIFITHQPQKQNYKEIIGPFTEGAALKNALSFLRKIYPFCTCKKSHQRSCLNSQLGLCFGWCCSKSTTPSNLRQIYSGNLRKIKMVLGGKAKNLLYEIKKEINQAVKKQDFEKAAKLKENYQKLEQIIGHKSIIRIKAYQPIIIRIKLSNTLKTLFKTRKPIKLIEAFDISLIQGNQAVGSMVVFDNFQKKPSAYKRFKIKTVFKNNDVAMLKEVISRRLNHPEWPYPHLMVIDGGKAQFNVAWQILKVYGLTHKIKLAAFAKPKEQLILKNGVVELKNSPELRNLIKKIDDEAHRFAISYHRLLRKKFVLAT